MLTIHLPQIQRTPVKQSHPGIFGDFRRPQRPMQRSIYDKTNISDTSENEIESLLSYHPHQGVQGVRTAAIRQTGPYEYSTSLIDKGLCILLLMCT